MNFRPELAAKVMAGEKTVTRRLVSDNPRSPWWREKCSLKLGRVYAVCPGRGKHAIGHVRVLAIRRERLAAVGLSEAQLEGFGSVTEVREPWSRWATDARRLAIWLPRSQGDDDALARVLAGVSR